MLLKDLQHFGLSKNLSTVYLALFELGEAKAGELIRKTGLHRNLVYTALDQLEQKKLIAKSTTRGVALFKALEPSQLLGELKNKELLAQNIIEQMQSLKSPHKQEVVVYEGIEEMRRKEIEAYSLMKKGEVMRFLGVTSSWHEHMGKKHAQESLEILKKTEFKVQVLTGEMDPESAEYIQTVGNLASWKVTNKVPPGKMETRILPDRVHIRSFVEPFTTIEIINPELVESYKKQFELIWEEKNVTLTGEEGIRTFLLDTLNYDDVYFIGGNGGMETYYPKVWEEYRKKRIEHKVFWHDLIDPNRQLSGGQAESIFDDPYYEYQFLPDIVASPNVICFYGDKVANIVWKEDSVINIVEDKEVVRGYKKYFDYLWNQRVKSYSGREEVENMYFTELLPELNKNHPSYCIGGGYGEGGSDKRVEEFYIRFHTERLKRNGHYQILFYEQHAETAYKEFALAGDKELKKTDLKFLPDSYYSPMQIHMIKNKVAVVYWGEVPYASLYEDPKIFTSFKKQFDLLWNQSVQSYTGWEEIKNLFLERLVHSLDAGETEYVLGANYPKTSYAKKHKDLFIAYNKKIVESRAKKQLLFYEADRADAQQEQQQVGSGARSAMSIRFLPESHRSPMEIHIYPNIVVVCVWGKKPIATVYKTKEMVDGFYSQFDLLWKQARS